jgi:hypothetical protein
MFPETGIKLTNIIFKLCIIQPNKDPNIDDYESIHKGTCTLQELSVEYYTQRKVYDSSMAYAGTPICPDVIALLTFTQTNFTDVFMNPSSSLYPIFEYLNTQANKMNMVVTRSVGLI